MLTGFSLPRCQTTHPRTKQSWVSAARGTSAGKGPEILADMRAIFSLKVQNQSLTIAATELDLTPTCTHLQVAAPFLALCNSRVYLRSDTKGDHIIMFTVQCWKL